MAPMRGLYKFTGSSADNNDSRNGKFGSVEHNNLDPVSALLRAGEIISQKSRSDVTYHAPFT
jgi:hypothetical protein